MDLSDVDFETGKPSESFVALKTYVVTISLMEGRDVSFETDKLAKSFVT